MGPFRRSGYPTFRRRRQRSFAPTAPAHPSYPTSRVVMCPTTMPPLGRAPSTSPALYSGKIGTSARRLRRSLARTMSQQPTRCTADSTRISTVQAPWLLVTSQSLQSFRLLEGADGSSPFKLSDKGRGTDRTHTQVWSLIADLAKEHGLPMREGHFR